MMVNNLLPVFSNAVCSKRGIEEGTENLNFLKSETKLMYSVFILDCNLKKKFDFLNLIFK